MKSTKLLLLRSTKKNDDKDKETKKRLEKIIKALDTLSPAKIERLEKILQTPPKQTYSITEVAEILGVDREIVRRNIIKGAIRAIRINRQDHYHIPASELEEFIQRC